jgi:hypothetical protein
MKYIFVIQRQSIMRGIRGHEVSQDTGLCGVDPSHASLAVPSLRKLKKNSLKYSHCGLPLNFKTNFVGYETRTLMVFFSSFPC